MCTIETQIINSLLDPFCSLWKLGKKTESWTSEQMSSIVSPEESESNHEFKSQHWAVLFHNIIIKMVFLGGGLIKWSWCCFTWRSSLWRRGVKSRRKSRRYRDEEDRWVRSCSEFPPAGFFFWTHLNVKSLIYNVWPLTPAELKMLHLQRITRSNHVTVGEVKQKIWL